MKKINDIINIVKESFEDKISIEMEELEMYEILHEILKIKPKIIVEIGVKYGGTLNIWRKIIPPDGFVIGIDSDNTLKFDITKDSRTKFIHGDSLNYKTYKDFLYILNNKEIDFLFIDGGHMYREVKSDFYTYGWHVRKNGLILFHDIYLNSEGEIRGSTKHFWDEIKEKYNNKKVYEVITEIKHHTGTGILRKL